MIQLLSWSPTCMHWNLYLAVSTWFMGPRPIHTSQLASITITYPLAFNSSPWSNVLCWWCRFWWWRFWWWSAFYIIIQRHISFWCWYVTVSWRIIIIWDKRWRCISVTNILWYLIHPFWTLPLFSYFPLTWNFLSLVATFRFIQTNSIQRRGRIYQFTILSKLLLKIKISSVFKTFIANRINYHLIFSRPKTFLKQIIKHNFI